MAISDAQQNREAQLKQAFQKHLPQRISAFQRRLITLCEKGWDINTLHLTYMEIQNLAGSAGNYGLVDVSNKLFTLEQFLAHFVESGELPGSEKEEKLRKLLIALNDYGVEESESPLGGGPDRNLRQLKPEPLPEPDIEVSGLPSLDNICHFVRPPKGFIPDLPSTRVAASTALATEARSRQDEDAELLIDDSDGISIGDLQSQMVSEDQFFEDLEEADAATEAEAEEDSDLEPASMMAEEFEDLDELFEAVEDDLDTPIEEPGPPSPQPEEEEPGEEPIKTGPDTPSIYFLHGGEETSRQLQVLLEDAHEIQSFTDPEEFMEVLNAIGPDAVIVDEAFLDRLDEVGPVVRKLRAKSHNQLPLIALSPQRDVATRLSLMRAGADAFFSTEAPVDEIAIRIADLLQTSPEDPFRVLVVEDDNSQAIFAQSILRRAGMQARTESDPLKVIDVMESFQPDLLLMDLHMPGCDGMELTAIIRERDEFVNTPIVFLSGEEDEDTHYDALLAGGDDFLSKPIRPRHLVSAVKNRVTRARAISTRGTAQMRVPDTVSGLVERPALLDRINAELVAFDPEQADKPGGVIYFELDRPLDVRRELGLPAFESLTGQLGPILTENLRDADLTARYGDNAYCMLIPQRSVSALQRRARIALDKVANHEFDVPGDRPYTLTMSAGVCPLSVQFADAASVIGAAERACNPEGENPPNRVVVHQTDSEAAEQEEVREIGSLIMDALDNNRFQLVFQPIASLQGEEIEQYHCLLRLPRDNGPTIPPRELLEAADELDMMGQIDRWVLKKALSVMAGSGEHSKVLRLFVNQSVAATEDKELPEWLMKSMESRKVPGSHLVMEFKLPEIVDSLKSVVDFRQALNPRRIRFCLGQFNGTETAFQILQHFPAEFVKLSPQFVAEHEEDGLIEETTTKLHEHNAMVIAPAVEDARAAVALWSSGIDYIQGHFVQEPENQLGYNFVNPV
ncbi:MAG: EAL domain-containing protein [Xanthomonadales bacterium]|nr:EAL domain-containing protein [Xanthomonadales bacterium]